MPPSPFFLLLTDPDIYLQMGKTSDERLMAYRGMVEEILMSAPKKKETKYSRDLYIGDPHWVSHKYKTLKTLLVDQRRQKRFPIPLSSP